ncbi:uncharacterized protein [Zea mays]|uniref:uncharacterized protein isoform X5 n=1 Tax=Zea mays TaxID=4577 RepID=UPI0004DEA4E9|nr:uncharacterized protein LOC100278132 isoform X5 [Zea mays]|eukprot:XP_023157723.1 uncharacterized protein LOC100278132 isoform X5 [Zea mays]
MQREMVHGHGDGNHHQHQQLPRYSAAAAATGVARASKKSKPKKIPQRGLGVAQLEKLRIEEQKMEGSMPVSGPTHLGVGVGGFGHLLPMHPPPHAPLPLLPRPGADGGVHCGYPSVLWDPASASAVADPMKHPFYKRSLCPLPPLPTWHGQVSVGLSLTAASSSHPTEPPSNQMYSSGGGGAETAAAEDDEDRVHAVVEEAAGVDRPWPLVFEGLNTTAFRTTAAGKAPLAVAARTTREAAAAAAGLPDACAAADLSRYEFSRATTNYYSLNASFPDWSSPELGHCKSSKEKEPAPAYLTLSAQPAPRGKQPPPALPSIKLPELGHWGVMQPPQHGSASASSSASASRPFYSFMPAGPVRIDRPRIGIKADDASDGVDLELKL